MDSIYFTTLNLTDHKKFYAGIIKQMFLLLFFLSMVKKKILFTTKKGYEILKGDGILNGNNAV